MKTAFLLLMLGMSAWGAGEMPERCEPCTTGRRDGNPCNVETCRCRCHREGVQAVEALSDKTLDKARESRPMRRVGNNAWVGKVEIEIREHVASYAEEAADPNNILYDPSAKKDGL